MSSAAAIDIYPASGLHPTHNPDRQATLDSQATVFIVDDDIGARQFLDQLIRGQGWQPQTCETVEEVLAHRRELVPSCLILAFCATNSNDLEVQRKIARECAEMTIIVTTDYEDIPTAVKAMKAGAFDFLMKPFSHELLLAAIRQGLQRSRAALERGIEKRGLRNCYASLTPREQQVMVLVVSGMLNKHVGAELGISEITVKAHRGRVMQKMKADSLAQLVSIASRLRITRSLTPGVLLG